ncbi:MAG: flagellar motor protein MotP [Epulopiscium sp. Nele67-Bin005]|nr:MAG: flagellar motor protein MotP [Epulopiscium sp. Nele67-Bin005]
MDIATPIGLVMGGAFMVISINLGGSISAFIDSASIMIVFGGLVAALLISYPLPAVITGFKSFGAALKDNLPDPVDLINQINDLAQAARKDGLLVLEEKAQSMEEPFLKKGVLLMVDGTEAELIRDILETDLAFMEERHKTNQNFWSKVAENGPAWGMIGTLIGLVNMLGALSDPSTLGPKMAVSLITTFYGSVLANWVANPVVVKMEYKSARESMIRQIMIEGLLSIQAGENPNVIQEKLKSFLTPAEREKVGEGGGGGE